MRMGSGWTGLSARTFVPAAAAAVNACRAPRGVERTTRRKRAAPWARGNQGRGASTSARVPESAPVNASPAAVAAPARTTSRPGRAARRHAGCPAPVAQISAPTAPAPEIVHRTTRGAAGSMSRRVARRDAGWTLVAATLSAAATVSALVCASPGRTQCARVPSRSAAMPNGRWQDAGGDDCKRARGASCSANAECATGFCADKVCCESRCDDLCTSCTNAATGKPNGECEPVRAGSDPRGECAAADKSTCGNDGMCDGAGTCRKWGTDTVCAAARCSSDLRSELSESRCDGRGTCGAPAPRSCGPNEECRGARCTPTCGDLNQPCCNNQNCNGALQCDIESFATGARSCRPCGGLTQWCCRSGTPCQEGVCGPGAMGTFCQRCGGPGEFCCPPGNTCRDGRACVTSGIPRCPS